MRLALSPPMLFLLIASLLIILAIESGHAEEKSDWKAAVNDFDRYRIEGYDRWWQQAWTEAENEKPHLSFNPAIRQLAASFAHAPALQIREKELGGSYRCRKILVGGLLTIAYNWMTCRIIIEPSRILFAKLTGSQRSLGQFYRDDADRYIYVGVGYYWNEKRPREYDVAEPKGDVDCNKYRNEAAILRRIGPNHYTLGFPNPLCESPFFSWN